MAFIFHSMVRLPTIVHNIYQCMSHDVIHIGLVMETDKTVKTIELIVLLLCSHQEACLSISLLALDRYKALPGIGVIATCM